MKDHLPWEPKRLLWLCPVCDHVNAFSYEDADRATARLHTPVAICTGSCFDNICGHCKSNIVEPDSPILSPCYTHSEE